MCKYCRNIPDPQLSPDEWCTHCRDGLSNISDAFAMIAYVLALLQCGFGFTVPVLLAVLTAIAISIACRVSANVSLD